MQGFKESKVDIFLKLGGSMLSNMDKCRELASKINELSYSSKIVIFPGGGPIDKYIEKLDTDIKFPPIIHHELCSRAQDQTGLIFGNFCPNAKFFSTFLEMNQILEEGYLAIMLPMKQIIEMDVFEQTWDITSDSMSAYFANITKAKRFAILTDVDGLFDNINSENPTFVPNISATELRDKGLTCVDSCLGNFLLVNNMTCTVLNGFNTLTVESWIKEEDFRGTIISPI